VNTNDDRGKNNHTECDNDNNDDDESNYYYDNMVVEKLQ
jgi:hypothetical protein